MAAKIAVGWMIGNRVNDGKAKSWWGEDYAGVCLKAWQFSCWNKDDPNFGCLSGVNPIPAGQFDCCRIDGRRLVTHCVLAERLRFKAKGCS